MTIIKKLYDQPFNRFLLNVFGLDSFFRRPQKDFIAYFQYKIGSYRNDYLLYFPRPPYANVYSHELYRKLNSYFAYDLTLFLDFHYQLYPDKKDFLRYLRYETTVRLKGRTPKTKTTTWWQTLDTCLLWIDEQEALLIAKDLATAQRAEPLAQPKLPQPLQPDLSGLEEKMAELTRSFSGKIELNNQLHLVKVIQVLIIMQNLKAPGKKPEILFRNCSNTDLASILRQFEEFRDKKLNTLQQKITECTEQLRPNEPKTERLIKALTDFFYSTR